jgi:hypothetical protein
MPYIATNQIEINRDLYPKAPTIEQIESFLKDIDIKPRTYERMVGMRHGTIADVKCGYRPLPLKWWHLIFERVTPTLGVIYESLATKTINRTINRKRPSRAVIQPPNRGILDKLSGLKD